LQKLGKYEILTKLGQGAMGVVYKARDPFIGRLVALKTINSSLVDRPDLLERFYQEAQSAGKLQHPNIVTIFDLGQEKDTPFIAMEYLDGESLEKVIVRQTNLPLSTRVGYIVRICQALEYAHKNRVVHRDIKPGNIMVNSEGSVKIVDFGIARLVDFSRTQTNMMIGTPAYMAPELFRKQKANERTDIWAVGVTFFELICYQRPFTGDGYDTIRSIMDDDIPPMSSLVADCPAEIESVIQRMLCKPTMERYQSMDDVLLDLEPVWNRLKTSEAAALVERGRELYELGDLLKAQETLRSARQIDSANTHAKSLLEKLTAELRRAEIEPKIQEHLSRSRGFIQAGQLREAQAEVEAALGLDSRHQTAQKLFSEVEAAIARAQQLEQKLRLAKQRFAEGALEESESALRQAFELDAANSQALDLQRQVGAERARRERRKQLSAVLHRARALWTEIKYDECLAVLTEALKNFPNEPELKSLQETARADRAEQRKQQHISGVRRLLGQQKLVEARQALETLANQHPQEPTVRNLQALLDQQEKEQKRKQRLEAELSGLRSLVSGGQLTDAIAKGELLLREFPQEYEVDDLVTYAKGEIAQQEQKRKEQEREKHVRALLGALRFREAEESARRAVQEFPNGEIFLRLLSEAEQKYKEQQAREKIDREIQQRMQDIRNKIKRQELTDAIDLARQTIATLGPDTGITQLLHAAEVQAAERERKRQDQLRAIHTMVDRGDLAGATQMLDQAIAAKTFLANDLQAEMLLAQITERQEALRREEERRRLAEERKRQEEEERRRQEEERRRAEQKAEEERKRQMAAVQALIGRDDLAGATQVLNQSIVAKIFAANDPRLKLLFTQIAERQKQLRIEDERRTEEERRSAEKKAEEERKRVEAGLRLREAEKRVQEAERRAEAEQKAKEAERREREAAEAREAARLAKEAEKRAKEAAAREAERREREAALAREAERQRLQAERLTQEAAAKEAAKREKEAARAREAQRRVEEIVAKEAEKRAKEAAAREAAAKEAAAREAAARAVRAPKREETPAQWTPGGQQETDAFPRPGSLPSLPRAAGAAANILTGRASQKPSVPVMTPLPEPPPARVMETEIQLEQRVSEAAAAPAAKRAPRKAILVATLGLVLAGTSYAVIHFWPAPHIDPLVSPDDKALEASAQQLWENHKLDEALASWKKLADHPGLLQKEAADNVSEIEQKHGNIEQMYAQGMKLLYEDKNYAEAARKFDAIVQMNLWKMTEAKNEYNIAMKGPGTPLKPLWQTLYEQGKQALDRKDYRSAQSALQQAMQANGVSSAVRDDSQRLIAQARVREQQKKDFEQAGERERNGKLQKAKDLFALVANIKPPKGDPDLVASAEKEMVKIGEIKPPPPPPRDYGPALAEARGLIGQGLWDDAARALSEVPPTQPGYSEANDAIRDGRREDQVFKQNLADYARAAGNKDALRKVRDSFMAEVNRGGSRHSAEAKNLVGQIDDDLTKLEIPKKPGEGSSGGAGSGAKGEDASWNDLDKKNARAVHDFLERYPTSAHRGEAQSILQQLEQYESHKQAILSVLELFNAAFVHQKPRELRDVWPDAPDEIVDALRQPGGFKVIFRLRAASDPVVSGSTAEIVCDLTTETTAPGRPPSHSDKSVKISLVKSREHLWRISGRIGR
jgi:serine/threonine protein kinase